MNCIFYIFKWVMQAEIDGKFVLVPFNTGGLTHMEILRNRVIEWLKTDPRNNEEHDYGVSFYNVSLGYVFSFAFNVSSIDDFTLYDVMEPGQYDDETIIKCVDKIKFNEERKCFELKTLPPYEEPPIEPHTTFITKVLSQYLCDIVCVPMYYLHSENDGDSIIVSIEIQFANIDCWIRLRDSIDVECKHKFGSRMSRKTVSHKYNDTTLIIKNVFKDLVIKYSEYYSKFRQHISSLLGGVEYPSPHPNIELDNEVKVIVESVEFNDFIKEIAKFEEFKHMRDGVGWLPKVKAAVKEE